MEFEEFAETVDVPRNTGTEGFLQLIRSILKLGRVQEIVIGATGRVSYKYRAPRVAAKFNPEQLFDSVSPAYVVRNSELRELRVPDDCHSVEVLFVMMRAARLDGAEPIAWVVGADTILPTWLVQRSSLLDDYNYPSDSMLGLPVFKDRMMPDESLTLCAGPRRGGELVDTTMAYKIAMVLP